MKIGKNISRILSYMLASVIMLSSFCLFVSSDEIENPASPFYNISCVYDTNSENVKIEYRMKNEDVKKYAGAEIFVYALPAFATTEYIAQNKIEPVSDALSASNRSTVSIPVSRLDERLSAYVLVMKTGTETIYSDIFSATVKSQEAKSNFKGIESSNISGVTESMANTVILDVNTDLMNGGSSGTLYTVEKKTYIFSSSYLSELDKKMKICSGMCCDIYLRLVSDVSQEELLSFSYSKQRDIYAYTSFLYSRYMNEDYGGIKGIIFGDGLSVVSADFIKGYVSSLYAAAVALEDMGTQSSLVLPVSGTTEQIKKLLTDFCDISEKYGLPSVNVMIESDRAPYGMNSEITDTVNSGGANDFSIGQKFNNEYVSSENIEEFENYIKQLASKTGAVFPTMIYRWSPNADMGKDAAVASYVYNFYKIYFGSSATSYIVYLDSLSEDREAMDAVVENARYIDSNLHSRNVDLNKIKEYFGFPSWESEIAGFSSDKAAEKTVWENELILTEPSGIKGVYNYFDFSSVSAISGWYEGCDGISVSSGKTDFGKGLMIDFLPNGSQKGFIARNYKYSESFKYTDVISVNFSLESNYKDEEYEVYVILGGENFRFEYSADGFKSGENYTVYTDVTGLTEENEVKYIRIGAVSKSDSSDGYKMHIYSVNAESFQYSGDELASLIEAERERLKSDEEKSNIKQGAIAFLIIAAIATAVVMIMVSKKSRQSEKTDTDSKN